MMVTEIRVKMKLQFPNVYPVAFKFSSLPGKIWNLHYYRLQRFY